MQIILKVLVRERLVNSGIRPSANSYKRMGCKAGDKCLFPQYKVDKQPNKNPKRATSPKEEKAMTRMLWLLCKVHHNWVASRKTRIHWFLKEENVLVETRCRKSWNQFTGYDSPSLRYVKRVPGKRKDHRWKKKCQSSSSAKSLSFEI